MVSKGLGWDYGITAGWTVFADILTSPLSGLEKLKLTNNRIDDCGAFSLAKALAQINTLKYLDLYGSEYITQNGWQQFFTNLQGSSLEHFHAINNQIDDDGLAALTKWLLNTNKLKELRISENRAITPAGWHKFSLALNGPPVLTLRVLFIERNTIDDEGIVALANSLFNNKNMEGLGLSYNSRVSKEGWQVFLERVLGNMNSNLRAIALDNDNANNEETISAIAHALAGNKSLRALTMRDSYSEHQGWKELCNAIFNKSSIDTTYRSNHTFNYIAGISGSKLQNELRSLLEMNKSDDSTYKVARQKILQQHFLIDDGYANFHIFLAMAISEIPHAIAWLGVDSAGFSLLYRLLRSVPSIFEFRDSAREGTKNEFR